MLTVYLMDWMGINYIIHLKVEVKLAQSTIIQTQLFLQGLNLRNMCTMNIVFDQCRIFQNICHCIDLVHYPHLHVRKCLRGKTKPFPPLSIINIAPQRLNSMRNRSCIVDILLQHAHKCKK